LVAGAFRSKSKCGLLGLAGHGRTENGMSATDGEKQ
jgi:hypothetical protein